jgi:DNA-binding PucR family transcriptional regulator
MHPDAVPISLLAEVREASRQSIGLDLVVRRYVAAASIFCDFALRESETAPEIQGSLTSLVSRPLALVVDEVLAAICTEYAYGIEERPFRGTATMLVRLKQILAGELPALSDISYDFDSHHLGAIAAGPLASQVCRQLAGKLDAGLLSAPLGDGTVWAWIGRREGFTTEAIDRALHSISYGEAALATGEPAVGLAGWRATHRQAQAARRLSQRPGYVRYGSVVVRSALMEDALASAALRARYLAPLSTASDGGSTLRETLRVYFQLDRNSVSAAAKLGVSRQTVRNRLRTVEDLIGAPLSNCAFELQAALALTEQIHV